MKKINRDSFLAFAKTKPSEEDYDFSSLTNCPIAQFAGKALYSSDGDYDYSDFHLELIHELGDRPWNWGALVQRIEEGVAL